MHICFSHIFNFFFRRKWPASLHCSICNRPEALRQNTSNKFIHLWRVIYTWHLWVICLQRAQRSRIFFVSILFRFFNSLSLVSCVMCSHGKVAVCRYTKCIYRVHKIRSHEMVNLNFYWSSKRFQTQSNRIFYRKMFYVQCASKFLSDCEHIKMERMHATERRVLRCVAGLCCGLYCVRVGYIFMCIHEWAWLSLYELILHSQQQSILSRCVIRRCQSIKIEIGCLWRCTDPQPNAAHRTWVLFPYLYSVYTQYSWISISAWAKESAQSNYVWRILRQLHWPAAQ